MIRFYARHEPVVFSSSGVSYNTGNEEERNVLMRPMQWMDTNTYAQ